MLFNSYIFVLVFLPIALLLYFVCNHFHKETFAKATLVLMSLWFYAYFHLSYILVIGASILINYLISGWMMKKKETAKRFLIAGIILNVLLIFYFKYLDFTLDNINHLTHGNIPLMHILMPLGISFFTFQQIGYLVDVYNGLITEHGFLDYALFVSFFPQLIAGPIVSYNEMVPQFRDSEKKKFDHADFALGLFWFSVGMAKKVLIADTLGAGSDWGYANVGALTGPEVILTGLLYTFRLYFDFSGYCDMACGIAKMFRIELPVNFLSPLKSLNIMEFWNKWHITLGRFLTGYLFNPMATAMNRKYLSDRSMPKEKKKKRKTVIGNVALFLTFFISGIWHGANWTFILWGTIQGIGRVMYQTFRKPYDKMAKGVRWGINFIFNVFSMALFGALSLPDFGTMLKRLPYRWKEGVSASFYENFNLTQLIDIEKHLPGNLKMLSNEYSFVNMILILLFAVGIALLGKNIYEMKKRRSVVTLVGTILMLTISILSMSHVTTFLYFNF